MADSVNLSLDEIIRASRSRGRGGANLRRRGGGRGRGAGNRGRSQTRVATPRGQQARSRSRSRSRSVSQAGARGRGRGRGAPVRGRRQSRARSRSRPQRRSISRPRSASRSRSQQRTLTPRSRAGLETEHDMPIQNRIGNFRGGLRNQVRRSRSNSKQRVDIHSRLGVTTRRGLASSARQPLALAKRGVSKRGRALRTRNKYSMVGLRSDQILKEQRQNMLLQNNVIKSQTFTRSRNNSLSKNNSFNSPSHLTVSVANDFAKRRRRNSVGNPNYLSRQSLAQLTNQLGGYRQTDGPGSVNSVGSIRSNRSDRSGRSKRSYRSNRSARGRARGRGVSRNFVIKPVLNVKLQKEIADIQGKMSNASGDTETPCGINFVPTPASTAQTLHQRFASS